MALHKYILLLAVVTIASSQYHDVVTAENKKKALEAEKAVRSAAAARDSASIKAIKEMLQKTKKKNKMDEIQKLNRRTEQNGMQNDNEGEITINQRNFPENDTNSLNKKIKEIRDRDVPPNYEVSLKNNYVPRVKGIFCNFENNTMVNGEDMCLWSWNKTKSKHGLGFTVVTAGDVVKMNKTSKMFKFSAPDRDGDMNTKGHFLYIAMDNTSPEHISIKSPLYRGLLEFCKFEASVHQSKMTHGRIKLVASSSTVANQTETTLEWILMEMTGNNIEQNIQIQNRTFLLTGPLMIMFHRLKKMKWLVIPFTISKIRQEINITLEISRPKDIDTNETLPHVAVDNIRMIECLPEPPIFNGECKEGQMKCVIMRREGCIKLQQICDLVKDCDNDIDEHLNCDKMPYGSYCDFERDSCGFEDVKQPILKWIRHSGPTPTDMTGPNHDHTCGPPDFKNTKEPLIMPPLAPAHMNITSTQCLGYYYYVNMNTTGADFASTAVVKTVVFNPPPTVHGDINSKYYNSCMVRFYYQQNGRNYGSLSVEMVELTNRGNITTSIWFSTKDKGEKWYRAAIFLPYIKRRYYLQIRTRMGMRIYSDSAIDDFSMAPECFGLNIPEEELEGYNYYDPVYEESITPHPDFVDEPFYRFTTCGAVGKYGPNQTMCDLAYNDTDTSVTVINQPPFEGVQVWEVPQEGYYTIIASGASGGLGSSWTGVSHGATATGLFELHKGELIYMLVGQQGLNACKKTLSAQESRDCMTGPLPPSPTYMSKPQEVRNTEIVDGGGGGGGATFVFLRDKDGEPYPLLVGGGGGGMSVGVFRDDGSQHARTRTNATPASGYMYGQPGKTSGAGGGWISRGGPETPGFALVRGAALREGGAGGSACVLAAHGGFGGGGGGCLRGGGGGGWIGGNTNQGEHGGGGYSYIDSARSVKDMSTVIVSQHMSQGEVVIVPAIHACGCDYRCVALNEYRSKVKCYCPSTWSTDASDTTKCILESDWPKISWWVIVVLAIAVFIFAMVVLCICLYLYNIYQKKKEAEIRRKRLLEQEVQLHRLRNPPGGNENALAAFNPHYGSESFFPQGIDVRGLPQVSRESLKLVKALGQGAFGEVYQGLYRHRTGDTVEMPVAVKTLPELSTGQSESDFLMEAAIMTKFNHPNIVHLIGVCFDRHPRFIVLELLAGGDLKNFLRESRPRPERASALTMKDLLLCALDVCKGCRYLEAKRFIHRDIAARNCLLTSRGPGRVVKIADFGMARDIYRADYYKKGGKAMLPIKWMPAEAFMDGVFTIKTDVWSYGVLLWEVFSLGVMPYTGCVNRDVMEMVNTGGRLEKPFGCPQDIYRLMLDCWNTNPEDRPSFAVMFDRLSTFLQDPEIVSAPLPVVKSLLATNEDQNKANGTQRAPPCDYLVPLTPKAGTPDDRATDQQSVHSKSPTAAQDTPETEDSPSQPLLKASQEYGNIPMTVRPGGVKSGGEAAATSCAQEMRSSTKFLPSNSTDRLLSSAEEPSVDDETASECDEKTVIWETSFTEKPSEQPRKNSGPAVEKLISITPTSPKPPENELSLAMERNTNVIDKTNHQNLATEMKTAPIASPDPPRINSWAKDQKPALKTKPLCLDAAQLEQNLNALKKNSGSVNLNTMNILPPYINVVTPNKLSESKTIQIDPKKAVIHDLQSPIEEPNEKKLKQSSSAASLLNGPMTDVPYADSDNASSSSSSNPPNHITNIQKSKQNDYSEVNVGKVVKQGSNGGGEYLHDSEISC